jgi:hypothetical protein
MKKLALAAVLAATASTAFAGGLVEPVQDPAPVVEQASSSGGILIPLLLLIVIAAAVAAD